MRITENMIANDLDNNIEQNLQGLIKSNSRFRLEKLSKTSRMTRCAPPPR